MNLPARILEAALKLYTSKPPQSVNMEEIAKEAGVSKGTIFYHFKNKNNLERKLIKYSIEKYFSWVYEQPRDSRTLEKIVRESLKIIKENPRLTLLTTFSKKNFFPAILSLHEHFMRKC